MREYVAAPATFTVPDDWSCAQAAYDRAEQTPDNVAFQRPVDGRWTDVTNREFQHVYLVCDERPLGAFTEIDRREMIELVAVPISGFSVLIGGGESAGISWDGIRERAVVVSGAELVPAPYLGELAEAMLLAGRA